MSNEHILILDFGSQYTQLIARRVREQMVYCKIVPFHHDIAQIKADAPTGIILSGGPASVTDKDAPSVAPELFDLGIPVLSICYGLQLMCHLLGGNVETSDKQEYGHTKLQKTHNDPFLTGISDESVVWMSHGDRVVAIPAEFTTLACSENTTHAIIRHRSRPIYGIQFHPEVAHTDQGRDFVRNFLFDICKCNADWTMSHFIETSIADIRRQVGDKQVVCGLSGGVDSAVTAVLLQKAIGDNLHCIFVDNGLLRHGEVKSVSETFKTDCHIKNMHVAFAADDFLTALHGVSDPEQKRKIIGHKFIDIFDRESKQLGEISFLAQGTLYPDVIESVSVAGPSAVIKSHHNVGGLPDKMNMQLVEPLRELFKDEVRRLGHELGMPEKIIGRQPFPGPGLAIRIIGEITTERLEVLRNCDKIVLEEIKSAGLYDQIWQSFAVLLPVKTVGVMGDRRTYSNVVAIRCVNSIDGMTANWVELPYEVLGRISSRIINETPGVNRVVYDISNKPPSTIEWE